jgi:hypothetical protein
VTIKAALWYMMDDLPAGRYGLWTLTDMLNVQTDHRTMPHTVKRYIREYCDVAASEFTCVVQNDSIYLWTPGYKISGSFIDK